MNKTPNRHSRNWKPSSTPRLPYGVKPDTARQQRLAIFRAARQNGGSTEVQHKKVR